MKENNKYIGSGSSNRLGSVNSGHLGHSNMSSSMVGMHDDENVNIGSAAGTHANTTPIQNKHQYRYGH